jgi:hypothetical protein
VVDQGDLSWRKSVKRLGLPPSCSKRTRFLRKALDHRLMMSIHPARDGDQEKLKLGCHGRSKHSKRHVSQSRRGLRLSFLAGIAILLYSPPLDSFNLVVCESANAKRSFLREGSHPNSHQEFLRQDAPGREPYSAFLASSVLPANRQLDY